MFQATYYVPKRTGTLSDALLAYGVATLLGQLLRVNRGARSASAVRLEDAGSHYLIALPEPIQEEWLKQRLPLDMALAIKSKEPLPDGIPTLDYNETWDEIKTQNELRTAQRTMRRAQNYQALQDLVESSQVQPHHDVTLFIGDYRMQAIHIHNRVILQWCQTVKAGYQAANIRAILQMFATPWSEVDVAEASWAKSMKLKGIQRRLNVSQVFNPSMGKGLIRTKGDKLLSKNYRSFWLLEYVKAVGLFAAAAPREFLLDEKKGEQKRKRMRKTYVLAPLNIPLIKHREIFKERFAPLFSGLGISPVKADILASLQYASAYLSYCREAHRHGRDEQELNPSKSIAGFYIASYALLNDKSYTMINLSFLGLPPWLNRIDTLVDVVSVQKVIEEHEQLIRPLQEELQAGSDILRAYREFLTGNRIDAFFDFCASYGEYVVHTLPTMSRVRQYHVSTLDELFRRIAMTTEQDQHDSVLIQESRDKDDLTEFCFASGEHPGFHRIAYAIRQSTVIPQRQNAQVESKERTEKSLYTVRYGLGHALRRQATSARELMDAVAEFMLEYNAETDQVYENTSPQRKPDPQAYARTHYRQRIQLKDLDDLLMLIKTYGPRLACNMLVAYGYAATGGKDGDGAGRDGNDVPSRAGISSATEKEEMLP